MKMLDDLRDELERLESSRSLLWAVWLEHGPYQQGVIPRGLWCQVADHFDFDDSE